MADTCINVLISESGVARVDEDRSAFAIDYDDAITVTALVLQTEVG